MPMSPEEKASLIEDLLPIISDRLLKSHRVFGDESRLHISDNVVLINTLFNLSSGHVYIDEYVFFGHNVTVLTGTHDIEKFDGDRMAAIPPEGRDIHIERGAWISTNATIIGPSRIGQNSVVGVGSIVIGDVRSGWFYAGVPAKPIKPVAPQYAIVEDASPGSKN